MSKDVDYNEVVEGTVDEVKQQVQDQDLDIDKVLEAEQANKERVTLVDWLEEQQDEAEKTAEAEDSAESEDVQEEFEDETSPDTATGFDEAATDGSTFDLSADTGSYALDGRNLHMLGVGLLAGIVLTAAVFFAGIVPAASAQGGLSADAAGEKLNSYVSDNKAAMQMPPGSNLTVQDAQRHGDSQLYEVTLLFEATIQNRSISRDMSAYVTQNGRYVFFGAQPLDMSQPLEQQIQQQQRQ